MAKKKKKKMKKTKRKIMIRRLLVILFLIILVLLVVFVCKNQGENPKLTRAMSTVDEFMMYINDGNYEEMYELISTSAKSNITKQDFTQKNQDIYGKLEAKYVSLSNMSEEIEESTRKNKSYIYKSNGNACRNFNFC